MNDKASDVLTNRLLCGRIPNHTINLPNSTLCDLVSNLGFLFFFFLKDFSFNVNHFFKVFIKFVTVMLLLYVLVFWPRSRWDLSSPHQRWNSHTLHGKVKS